MSTIEAVIVTITTLAACVALVIWSRLPSPDPDRDWPVTAKKPLGPEALGVHHDLTKALPECLVLADVRLSQLLTVKKGEDLAFWHERLSRMWVDFAICDRDGQVLAVVELAGAHQNTNVRRLAEQQDKTRALTAAGLRIVRWTSWDLPEESGLRQEILDPRTDQDPVETHMPPLVVLR